VEVPVVAPLGLRMEKIASPLDLDFELSGAVAAESTEEAALLSLLFLDLDAPAVVAGA
jgi:hypothetical protein